MYLRFALTVAFVLLGALALAACGGSTKTVTIVTGGQSQAPPKETTVTVTATAPETSAGPTASDFSYKRASCDLGEKHDLIGSVRTANKADAPLTATLRFSWELGDGSSVKAADQHVELQPGEQKLVFFKKYVSQNTQLSFQDHPDYFNGTNCTVTARIGD